MNRWIHSILFVGIGLLGPAATWAADAAALRLVPFPKEVRLASGAFDLQRPLVLEAPADRAETFGRLLNDELQRARLPAAEVRRLDGPARGFRLSDKPGGLVARAEFRPKATPEDYVLTIQPDEITAAAPDAPGLFYALATLRQMIRANRQGHAVPCVAIRDWPSLRWRCFQDDMTRGPSSTLDTLKFEAALGAYLKFNLMTYYMEHQFAFQKHPKIGPPGGSLTPEELKALVEYVKPLSLDVMGNQQSFGHFGHILKHPEYAHLREGADVLTPVKDETYQLLDDMYSEVCPLLPFPFFNVCCDETWELGRGPSKELAAKIGVGGVYVRHIRRVYDLVVKKYKKRMMMWGDIILQHPENLKEIPTDTIMLTWGYGDRPSFEDQIVPFAKSGYEFFVCPGVSNWSRILPDFGVATVNIRNFVRDGAKHGAIGMLNTDWEDDGEALNAVKWYGDAWAAECAWNASATPLEAFNRRVGAVLVGESGDRLGRAIELLAPTHRMRGMRAMLNARFWDADFPPPSSPATIENTAGRLLKAVRPAIEHLEACKNEATANQNIVDAYLFGARRMERIGQRMLDGLEAARLYDRAREGKPRDALPLLGQIEALVRTNRDAHAALGKQFAAIWLSESKPYGLDWTMARYEQTVKGFDDLLARLAKARQAAESGKPLPGPEEVGLVLPEAFARRARPKEIVASPLAPQTPWAEPAATHRLGLVVRAGAADRHELPVEVEVALPPDLASRPVRAFCTLSGHEAQEVLAQVDPAEQPGKCRLVLLLPSRLAKGEQATIHVYLGLPAAPKPLSTAAATRDAPNGMKWLENDRVRLLLGPEGSHIYRWEIKQAGNRDLTQPGEAGWAGFCDIAARRSIPYRLVCLADGPAMVRYQCVDPEGHTKTISLYGGTSWIEVMLDEPIDGFWNFDTPRNFAADGPTPGEYLFSNGAKGPVGKEADGVPAQVEAPGTFWSIKFNREKLALGMATPETAALHHVAPGSGAGGVGIEHSPPASHFVIFAGLLEREPAETMRRLSTTLDLPRQPDLAVHGLQIRPTP